MLCDTAAHNCRSTGRDLSRRGLSRPPWRPYHTSQALKMRVPSVQEANRYLAEARLRNPGAWAEHSVVAAEAARAIAARHPALDPACAYVLGLLHDIGRGALTLAKWQVFPALRQEFEE